MVSDTGINHIKTEMSNEVHLTQDISLQEFRYFGYFCSCLSNLFLTEILVCNKRSLRCIVSVFIPKHFPFLDQVRNRVVWVNVLRGYGEKALINLSVPHNKIIPANQDNHKNYNFLDCDWFTKLLCAKWLSVTFKVVLIKSTNHIQVVV